MEDYGTLLYPEDMHKYSNPSASAWFRSILFLHSSNDKCADCLYAFSFPEQLRFQPYSVLTDSHHCWQQQSHHLQQEPFHLSEYYNRLKVLVSSVYSFWQIQEKCNSRLLQYPVHLFWHRLQCRHVIHLPCQTVPNKFFLHIRQNPW